ncbi:hypothetical protein E3Q02_01941 [Wallemia mellicola]|uniref:FHA domain-containing protein n=1 Tax=Wallemia mellicola TaxID=1708541 RepID=A0AB38MUT2_9BASI|nr:hypothetical protein E3Q02_01941 [Wallemia mellicola]
MKAVKRPGYETIAAYAKLHFKQEHYAYYLQCLSVNIGRRSTTSDIPIDVDLGSSKSISRLHASISYDFERELFNLNVDSINGLWVEGLWYGKGARIELGRKTKIQIATKIFWFVMPSEKDIIPASTKNPTSTKKAQKTATSAKPSVNNGIPVYPQVTEHTINNHRRPNVAYTTLIAAELQNAGVKLTVNEICILLMQKYDWFAINKDSGWQTAILLNLTSGNQFHKMENHSNQFHTKWTLTSIFETSLANKQLSPRSIQLSLAANKTQSSNNKNDIAKAAKAMATQSTASISSLSPDMNVNMKVQNLKQPQMPITMNNQGTLLLHPDIFGSVSKEQLQGLSVVPFTNVLTFLHNTISSKAFERLSNGKGLGSGFAAIQQQQSKSSTSAARIQAQQKAEAEKKKLEEQQQQQNNLNNLFNMLANSNNNGQHSNTNIDNSEDADSLALIAMLQQQSNTGKRANTNDDYPSPNKKAKQ